MAMGIAILAVAPVRVSAQTLTEAEQLADLCGSHLNRAAFQEAVTACSQALAIALPLAKASQRLGMEKFRAGKYRAALSDFEEVQQIWIPLKTALMGRAIAYGMLGEPKRARNSTREATAASFLLAEACINAGKAQVALGDRAAAARSFVEALENNQEALHAFRANTEAAVAGRGNYLRGIAKAALADLGSPRGDRMEACEAYRKAATLGYEPGVKWMASEEGAWCRPGAAGIQP
jgi:tetratricopeptide (TPR) repeat protein